MDGGNKRRSGGGDLANATRKPSPGRQRLATVFGVSVPLVAPGSAGRLSSPAEAEAGIAATEQHTVRWSRSNSCAGSRVTAKAVLTADVQPSTSWAAPPWVVMNSRTSLLGAERPAQSCFLSSLFGRLDATRPIAAFLGEARKSKHPRHTSTGTDRPHNEARWPSLPDSLSSRLREFRSAAAFDRHGAGHHHGRPQVRHTWYPCRWHAGKLVAVSCSIVVEVIE